MRRAHRLPPVTVSHIEKYHAYTSPPMPEKGGLPTIIVTPADSSSIQDFEVHFVSPKASQTTFCIPSQSQGILPRMRSFFRRPTEQSSLLEKVDYFSDEEEDIAEGRYVSVSVLGTGNGGYSPVPQSEAEILGVPTISESDWTTISAASPSNGYSAQPIFLVSPSPSGASPSIRRRVRTLLFLSVPIALVAFHLISHHIGLFYVSGMDGAEMWTEAPSPLSGPVI